MSLLFDFQEEQYDHLDEADVSKVDKLTSDAMIWMNSTMNQQSKQSLTVDPSVKVKDIQAKTRVSVRSLQHHNSTEESDQNAGHFKMENAILKINVLFGVTIMELLYSVLK